MRVCVDCQKDISGSHGNRKRCDECNLNLKRKGNALWHENWRKENPEKNRQRLKRAYDVNPEKYRETSKQWRRDNPERAREYDKQYRERRKNGE